MPELRKYKTPPASGLPSVSRQGVDIPENPEDELAPEAGTESAGPLSQPELQDNPILEHERSGVVQAHDTNFAPPLLEDIPDKSAGAKEVEADPAARE